MTDFLTLPSDYIPAEAFLAHKTILVTGAGDGIGRAAAIAYAKHGATVILSGRTVKKLEAVYDEIEKNGGPQAAIYPIDFAGASEQDYQQLYNTIAENFGQLDGLLHNAGLLGAITPISQFPAATWEQLFKVNVTAPFLLTKHLAPVLEKAGKASVVFTSSSVAFQGRAYWGAYAASKAAQENLMQTLADEWESLNQVRVNSINPGAVRTKMRAIAYPGENPYTLKTPDEIVALYLYLMDSEHCAANGQAFAAQPK